jgi:hypothetical protein
MKMVASMKGSGIRTFAQDMAMNCTKTLTLITASMLMENHMRKVSILGITEKYMTVNGAMVSSRAMVFGVGLMGSSHTSGNG